MLSLDGGAAAATELSCTLFPFKYRGPIISGCEFHVTNRGIAEYYTINNGQVFTGVPTFSQRERDATSHSRKNCPKLVVREIDAFLSNEGMTWDSFKSSMQIFYNDLSATDVAKLSLSPKIEGASGALSISGDFFQIDEFKIDEFGFFWTMLENGTTVTVSVANNVELTMAADWGALDYRGTCEAS